MEGVGARLGRSSSRYGTTTVFNGPVRRWKKKWVPVSPSSNNHSSAPANHHHQPHHSSLANGANGGSNASHLVLYKWTPLSQSNKENNNSNSNTTTNWETKKEEDAASTPAAEEPPRRKFKYVPIAVLEEQNKETEEISEDEAKPGDHDGSEEEATPKNDGGNEKPDINDFPMEESRGVEEEEEKNGGVTSERQDLNVSTLDLSLGLTSHEGEPDSDSKTDPEGDGHMERENSGNVTA